jgi:hypothetical protein
MAEVKTRFGKFLYDIDMVGPTAQLNTYSNKKFKTVSGGIITIITALTLCSFSIYFSVLTFGRKKASMIQNRLPNDNPWYDYYNSPIMIGLVGSDLTFNETSDSKLYNIKAKYHHYGSGFSSVEETNISVSRCDSSVWGQNEEEFSSIYFAPLYYCLDINDPFVKDNPIKGQVGSFDENGFYAFYINKCVNDTSDIICGTDDQIKSATSNIFLGIVYVDYYIDSTSYHKPGNRFLNTIVFPLDQSVYKGFILAIQNIDFTTDSGYVLSDFETKNYYTFLEYYYENTDLRNATIYPGNFASVYFTGYKTKTVYIRTYQKIQDLFASIGGVAKGLFLIVALLEHIFMGRDYFFKLYEDLILPNKNHREVRMKLKDWYQKAPHGGEDLQYKKQLIQIKDSFLLHSLKPDM